MASEKKREQDAITGYQEQLAQASEQLCLLKRPLFGRRLGPANRRRTLAGPVRPV